MHPRNCGSHVTVRPPDRPHHRHTNSINRYGYPNAAQGFIWQEFAWPPGLLERKNNNKVPSFSTLSLMSTLTWITEKELERVIANKGDEFRCKKTWKCHSGGDKMRNASGQQGENERQWKKLKANRNTSDKIFGEHIRQFRHTNFANIRSIDFVVILIAVPL